MVEKTCTISFNQDSYQACINGLSSENFHINYSGDIDLTPLVFLLSEKIEDGNRIRLTCSNEIESQTDKEKILLDTLSKIFDSFNQSFNAENQAEDSFITNEELTKSDDLPF